jgi:hypothetical protein
MFNYDFWAVSEFQWVSSGDLSRKLHLERIVDSVEWIDEWMIKEIMSFILQGVVHEMPQREWNLHLKVYLNPIKEIISFILQGVVHEMPQREWNLHLKVYLTPARLNSISPRNLISPARLIFPTRVILQALVTSCIEIGGRKFLS